MKIRETINSNAEVLSAVVYEDKNKIVVVKHDTFKTISAERKGRRK